MPAIAAGCAALPALGSCGPVSTGGPGQLTDGTPLSGLYVVHTPGQDFERRLISAAGWTCTSRFGPSATPGGMARTVPLTCTDRRSGTLVLTGNQMQPQIEAAFRLSDGTARQVTFGRL